VTAVTTLTAVAAAITAVATRTAVAAATTVSTVAAVGDPYAAACGTVDDAL